MLFSIAMPVYNAEAYIDEAVKSVLSQSEKDYELILVNDGSSDCSLKKCRRWEKKFPERIRVVDKDNEGSLITRRRCLNECVGDYIYLMDADDKLTDSNMLKEVKDRIRGTGCDMVLFDYVTDSGKRSKLPLQDGKIYEKGRLAEIYTLLIKSSINALWNKIFSRELVDWDADYTKLLHVSRGTDLCQTIPLVSAAQRVLYIGKPYYCYTMSNESSILHTFKKDAYVSLRANHMRLCEYAKKWSYPPRELDRMLDQRTLNVASSAAFKLVGNKTLNRREQIDYLSSIGEDDLFRKAYGTEKVALMRRIIVCLLYHRRYGLLQGLFSLYKRICSLGMKRCSIIGSGIFAAIGIVALCRLKKS